jgi:beta-1,4-mannosyl-glycoprotein beta-1,4-N-acetylglucosaminyltransferase
MIYDCFTFFNELDLLEIRLNTLNEVVDKFVLVEATLTHQGKPKQLYFSENKSRFKQFEDKIIHIVVDAYPDYKGKSNWVLEHHQRNMIMQGLKGCRADDIILISDLDEIPDPQKIKQYKSSKGTKIFRLEVYYYYLNCRNVSEGNYKWNGTIMVKYDKLEKPQEFREMSMELLRVFHKKWSHRIYWKIWSFFRFAMKGKGIKFIDNGGWHFSFLGGAEMIIKKLEAFAHSEYNKQELKDTKKIEEAILNGKDIFGRDFKYRFVPIDRSFPLYIQENKQKYSSLIKE